MKQKKKKIQYRVAISPSSFSVVDDTPKKMLEQTGLEIVPNPYGRRLTEDEIIDHLNGVHGLIAGLEPLNRRVLESASKLKAIARVGIGMNNIDLEATRDLNIRVSNTPDEPTEAVAEMCLTSLLILLRQIVIFNDDLHKGIWKKRIGISLRGTKVLLIGYGRIGKKFGDMLRFFDAEIMVIDPLLSLKDLQCDEKLVSLYQGIKEAEVISLHANAVSTILGQRQFQKMRPGMIILNSARGELIDEKSLIYALESGIVSGAWLDTFWQEPYTGRLKEFNQVLLTPHISTYTRQCRKSMEESAVKNLLRDLGVSIDE